MAKFVHDNHNHVYYVSKGVYKFTVKQYSRDDGVPASALDLSQIEYENFMKMLKHGGWYEQSTGS